METGMNTLQRSQQNLQHHSNGVSSLHATKRTKTVHFENTVADCFRSAFDRTGCLQLSQKAI